MYAYIVRVCLYERHKTHKTQIYSCTYCADFNLNKHNRRWDIANNSRARTYRRLWICFPPRAPLFGFYNLWEIQYSQYRLGKINPCNIHTADGRFTPFVYDIYTLEHRSVTHSYGVDICIKQCFYSIYSTRIVRIEHLRTVDMCLILIYFRAHKRIANGIRPHRNSFRLT